MSTSSKKLIEVIRDYAQARVDLAWSGAGDLAEQIEAEANLEKAERKMAVALSDIDGRQYTALDIHSHMEEK